MKIAQNVLGSLRCSQLVSRASKALRTLLDKFIPPNLRAKNRTTLALLFGLGLLCISSRALAQSGTWTAKAPELETRIESAGAALGGLFHLFGESNVRGASAASEVYDPGSNRWTTGSPATPAGTPAPTPPNLFGRLSTRAFVSTGDNVLISGFIVTGTAPKKVLVRALGLSLTGVSGQLADPTLELRDGNGALLIANNNWQDNAAQAAQIIATGQAPSNNLESALVITIPPGAYTAIVRGSNNTTGVGMAEIIDVDTSNGSQLANISSRAVAGPGDNVMVGGFTINGPQSQRVLIRGIGPSLTAQGVPNALANPTLDLRDGNGNTLVFNNDWRDTQEAAIQATGIPPTNNLESAMVVTLIPGSYTAVLAGACNITGVALVEVYELGLAGNMTEIPPSSPPPPCPPVITSPLVATGTIGLPFTYQFTASGATSYAVNSLAPGLTFNASLRAITGIPTTAGIFQVGLSATNSQGTTNAALILTVQATPAGLAIVSSTCATGRTGSPFSFQLQTKGGSSATNFAVDALPPGLNLDPVTGFISGTPTTNRGFGLAVSAIDGAATAEATLQLTFTSDPTVPIITSPHSAILTPGQFFTYTIAADANGTFGYIGTDGIVHQGASSAGLPPGLSFDGDRTISGVFNPPFAYDGGSQRIPDLAGGIVTNVQLFATDPSGTGTFPLIGFIAAPGTVNISTRLAVGTGDNVLIGGFIITGTGTTRTLIRAIGPSLTPLGVPNALQNPILELRDGAGSLLSSNDNWQDNQSFPITDTGIPLTNNLESGILAFLSPGPYTAIVRGNNNTAGVALVEVYDLGIAALLPPGNARLANIATRGFADTGDNVMIGGFIVRPQAPSTSTRIIARAIGPSLAAVGVPNALLNPSLELKDGNGATLISNDDWQQGTPADVQEIQKLGLAPTDTRESAVIRTLVPGPYTAIVRGNGGTTGVALVEVYSLP